MKNLVTLIVAATCAAMPAMAAVTVTNIAAAQRPGTKLVDITYDVSSDSASEVYVGIVLSNGAPPVVLSQLTGDVGFSVTTGVSRTVVWDGGAETNGLASSLLQLGIEARDDLVEGADMTAESWVPIGSRWVKNTYTNGHVTMSDRSTTSMWSYNANLAGTTYNWWGALDYCNNLTYADYSDWVLPDINVLTNIYSEKAHFINVANEYYWSTTTYEHNAGLAYVHHMGGGYSGTQNKAITSYYAWPTRTRDTNFNARVLGGAFWSGEMSVDFRDLEFTVASASGTPSPAVGTHMNAWGTTVTCSVDSAVTEYDTEWTCSGWTGTGSFPTNGTTNTTGEVMITNLASTITWNWSFNDTDADGLPDTWEQANLGNMNAGANDDPDQDGRSHIEEFGDNTDPRDTCSTLGLMACYPFTGNAEDATTNDNDGVVSGATLATNRFGRLQQAYAFDGIDDNVTVSDHSSLDITEALTIGMWVYAKEDKTQVLALKAQDGTAAGSAYILRWFVGNGVFLEVGDGTAQSSSPKHLLALNQWHHVVGYYDGLNVGLYVDGVHIGSNAGPSSIRTTTTSLVLGQFTGYGQWFNGQMDDIRIYNRAISTNEIATLFASYPTCTLTVMSDHGNPSPPVGPSLFPLNTNVNCYVAALVTNAGYEYACTGWDMTGHSPLCGTSNSFSMTVTNDATLTWQWALTNVFWVDTTASGSGTVSLADGWYPAGSTQSVSALPDYGWLFTGWSGDLSGDYSVSNTTLYVDTNKSVTGGFSDDPDGDGVKNTNEWALGLNPRDADTDGDGFDDRTEVDHDWPADQDDSWALDYISNRKPTFGLYTESELGNLALGGLMIECSNDTINLELQLRASEDLRTTWSNAGDAVEWQMQTPPDKHFYQVTGSE